MTMQDVFARKRRGSTIVYLHGRGSHWRSGMGNTTSCTIQVPILSCIVDYLFCGKQNSVLQIITCSLIICDELCC